MESELASPCFLLLAVETRPSQPAGGTGSFYVDNRYVSPIVKTLRTCPVVIIYTFSPITQQAEAGRSL